MCLSPSIPLISHWPITHAGARQPGGSHHLHCLHRASVHEQAVDLVSSELSVERARSPFPRTLPPSPSRGMLTLHTDMCAGAMTSTRRGTMGTCSWKRNSLPCSSTFTAGLRLFASQLATAFVYACEPLTCAPGSPETLLQLSGEQSATSRLQQR
jgi:hypothetical protein